MAALAQMAWWMDPVRRSGPEAMAVDEWLLQHADCPVLRVYQWAGDWASLGYFGKLSAARAGISGVKWVRRWTGGGAVDRADEAAGAATEDGEAELSSQNRPGFAHRFTLRPPST